MRKSKKYKREKDIFERAYFPDRYINRITDVNSEFFKEENIKGVIIDVDNTVIDVKKNLIDGLLEWKNELVDNDIKVVILSNTIDRPKVLKIAEFLDIEYFIFGRKPNLIGFSKAKRRLGLPSKNIAVIGDQIFTDVLGANKAGMLSILVNPLQEHLDYLPTRLLRPIEETILANYLKYIEENENNPKKYNHVLNALEQRIENQKKGKDTSHTTKLSKILKKVKLEQKLKENKLKNEKKDEKNKENKENKENKGNKGNKGNKENKEISDLKNPSKGFIQGER